MSEKEGKSEKAKPKSKERWKGKQTFWIYESRFRIYDLGEDLKEKRDVLENR